MAQMTIAVYRISGRTGERTVVRTKRTVKPGPYPELTSAWPACACPRCRKTPASGKR